MIRFFCALVALAVVSSAAFAADSIYSFTPASIDNKPAPMSAWKGKVMLLVNVASKCGYTPQYKGLESVYEEYKDRGLVIVGFPANNFGAQEPGTNEEIQTFCSRTYNVTFPMMSKISVKGDDQDPIYRFLTSPAANPVTTGDIKWNFTKFLVDRQGKVLARFEPAVTPDSADVRTAIEKALRP
jgi:glutathione peroxidase